MHEALFQKLKNGVGNSIILYVLERDIMFKGYQDERYRVQAQGERHETIRFVSGALGVAIIVCSLIWSITYYNVEALKVPISVSHTDVHNTQVDRGGSGN